jgi:hypothetical protein
MQAKSAFAGATVELERTAPLDADEDVLLHGAMRLRGAGLLPRPVVLRLTAGRLTVLAHYAFRPDRVWDLPRGAVRDAELVGDALHVTWVSDQAGNTAVLKLTGWSGRSALDRALRDPGAVAGVLLAWLTSPDGQLPVLQPPSHRQSER